MTATLVDLTPGLWWVAITSTAAAVVVGWCVRVGLFPAITGMIVAAALALFAVSYWATLFGFASPHVVGDMRRAAGGVLWPSMIAVCLLLLAARERLRR